MNSKILVTRPLFEDALQFLFAGDLGRPRVQLLQHFDPLHFAGLDPLEFRLLVGTWRFHLVQLGVDPAGRNQFVILKQQLRAARVVAGRGHLHSRQRFYVEGLATRFEQTGAVIGPSEASGIKMPSGVMLYNVKDGKIDEGRFIPLDKK